MSEVKKYTHQGPDGGYSITEHHRPDGRSSVRIEARGSKISDTQKEIGSKIKIPEEDI